MAEDPKIDILIRTRADTSGTAQTTQSIEKTKEAAEEAKDTIQAAGEAAATAEAKVNKAAQAAAKAADGAAEAVEEASTAAAEGMAETVETGNELLDNLIGGLVSAVQDTGKAGEEAGDGYAKGVKGKLGGIQWTQDALTAAGKAWELGTLIGTELGKAMEHYAREGSLDGFFDVWIEGIGRNFGLMTDHWDANIRRVKEASELSLVESKKQFAEWRESLSKPPTEDAVTWLKNLAEEARTTQAALEDLRSIQAAMQRAAMDQIGQDEADKLAAIDADPVLTDGEKIRARQRVRNETESQRLTQRQKGFEQERKTARNTTEAAQSDLEQKRAIEGAQDQRAVTWNEIKAMADSAGRGADGKVDPTRASQQFDLEAKRRGITDMKYGDDEQKKLDAARKAREESEAAAAEAERRERAIRQRTSIEESSDVTNTQRTQQRETGQAEREAQAADARDAAAAQVERDKAAAAEQARLQGIGNEAATRAVGEMDSLISQAVNPEFKAKLEMLRATLTDSDGATAADVQRIQSFLEQVKTSNADAQRAIANTLSGMVEVQKNFNADIHSLQAQVTSLRNASRVN